MTEVKWIKLLTGMFDDEKIKLIEDIPEADTILIIWIKLLTLAGKKNVNGYIFLTENIPYTDEMLATIFKRPLNTIRLALETFRKFKMISYDENDTMFITNWEKHQNIEGLEKIREQNRRRQERFRKEQKKLDKPKKKITLNNVTVTEQNRIDKNRLDKKKKKKYNDVVFLTNNEYDKLVEELGEPLTKEYIERLSLYMKSRGLEDKYNSHYATILAWNRKDKKKDKSKLEPIPQEDNMQILTDHLKQKEIKNENV